MGVKWRGKWGRVCFALDMKSTQQPFPLEWRIGFTFGSSVQYGTSSIAQGNKMSNAMDIMLWHERIIFWGVKKKKAKCKLLFSLVLKFPGFKMGIATFFQSYYYFICVHAQLCPVLCDSMEFSRQEYWSGLPFPSPGDCPDPGMEPVSLASSALAGGFFTTGTTWEHYRWQVRCMLRSGRFSDKNLKSHFHNQSCSN